MARRKRRCVLIADNHTLTAEACRALLQPEFDVIGVVAGGGAMLRAADALCPDVVVVNIAMPQLNGLDAGYELLRRHPKTKLIFLAKSTSADLAAEAFRRGAAAYVVKRSTVDELVTAVRRVLCGEAYLSSLITKETVEFLLRTNKPYNTDKRMSPRQAEVLQLLAEGNSIKEIADILDVKLVTVASYMCKIKERLELKANDQLIEFARKSHIVFRGLQRLS